MPSDMPIIDQLHGRYVFDRRTQRLARLLAGLMPRGARVLDVGCGDGRIARLLLDRRPDVSVRGIDVLVREHTHIQVDAFDGRRLPFERGTFDVVMFVDVLHHTDDPMVLLREAERVAGSAVVIKDHLREGLLAEPTLRFMDRVGNERHGVRLPYNYWPRARWSAAWRELGLEPEEYVTSLGLYPPPASWVFGRSLHFVARLGRRAA